MQVILSFVYVQLLNINRIMLDFKNMDFLKIKQKIFIVGGSGLLGSEICNLLSGYQAMFII